VNVLEPRRPRCIERSSGASASQAVLMLALPTSCDNHLYRSWAIPRWTAQSDTLALSLKTRWLSPKQSKSKSAGRLRGRPIAAVRRSSRRHRAARESCPCSQLRTSAPIRVPVVGPARIPAIETTRVTCASRSRGIGAAPKGDNRGTGKRHDGTIDTLNATNPGKCATLSPRYNGKETGRPTCSE